jgi:D-hydroxyproline dehydrogenase subunit gamma
MNDAVPLFIDGRACLAPSHLTVAAAIARAGGETTRVSVHGQPRAPLCGMGTCLECRVTIDGRPHQRACQILVRAGMVVFTGGLA